jgi:hypothetical protein
VLEENHCFDAEMYADDLELEEQIDFRDDHRSMSSLQSHDRYHGLIWNSKSWQMDSAVLVLKPD